jgi:hypothetical protein
VKQLDAPSVSAHALGFAVRVWRGHGASHASEAPRVHT